MRTSRSTSSERIQTESDKSFESDEARLIDKNKYEYSDGQIDLDNKRIDRSKFNKNVSWAVDKEPATSSLASEYINKLCKNY